MSYDLTSLLGRWQPLPDPRRRQGRRYPLPALLGLLMLAALQGEPPVRGRWVWACQHWNELWWPLGVGSPHVPARTTMWHLLGAVDAEALDRLVRAWIAEVPGPPVGGVRADGKVLWGSRREPPQGVVGRARAA